MKRSGNKLDACRPDDADGFLGERLHLHEPLRGDEGLDIVVAAVAGADVVGVRLGLDEVALLRKVLDDGICGTRSDPCRCTCRRFR